jgi:hypothetical protein
VRPRSTAAPLLDTPVQLLVPTHRLASHRKAFKAIVRIQWEQRQVLQRLTSLARPLDLGAQPSLPPRLNVSLPIASCPGDHPGRLRATQMRVKLTGSLGPNQVLFVSAMVHERYLREKQQDLLGQFHRRIWCLTWTRSALVIHLGDEAQKRGSAVILPAVLPTQLACLRLATLRAAPLPLGASHHHLLSVAVAAMRHRPPMLPVRG